MIPEEERTQLIVDKKRAVRREKNRQVHLMISPQNQVHLMSPQLQTLNVSQ